MANKTDEAEKVNEAFDEKNADALTDMLTDQQTSEAVRLQIVNELIEESKDETFFETMFAELLSEGECPCCGHKNHWLIPEDELNIMGWVSHEKDPRVLRHTTVKDCPTYQECCSKKRVSA